MPLEVIIEASDAATIVAELVGKTNQSAESDLKIGLMFLNTTIYSAWDNIEINLKYISDEEFKKPLLNLKEKIMKM